MATTAQHQRPNYILIWGYLFGLTVLEVLFAFEVPFSRNAKILILLFLAVWKALLVALYFMHLKFEPSRLRLMVIIPLPLAVILVCAVITEHIW
jgi:cytochrome c oxidase subunit 4